MSLYLRELYSYTKWKTRPKWLQQGVLPSCVIRDLRADDNSLSLWEIQADKSNLLSVITALASLRKSVKNDFDYALLAEEDLNKLLVSPTQTDGATPYADMNVYHRDLARLPIEAVVQFAYLLSAKADFDRMGWKEVEDGLRAAVIGGFLDLARMDDKLKRQLETTEPPAP